MILSFEHLVFSVLFFLFSFNHALNVFILIILLSFARLKELSYTRDVYSYTV